MEDILREIKAEFRAGMNGVASRRMREAGLRYHVNFGIELPRLQQIAGEVRERLPLTATGHELHSVAQALWHEDVRESKILAAMLMPVDRFPADLADLWVSQIPNAEIAQTTVLYLFARLPYAADLVFPWMASDREMLQLCGTLLATRLIIRGVQFNERSRQELTDQARSLSDTPGLHLRRAAQNLLLRLGE